MDNQTPIGVPTFCKAFYISKWLNQENIFGQTICLNLSFEKYGHLAMFSCQTVKTENGAGKRTSLMLRKPIVCGSRWNHGEPLSGHSPLGLGLPGAGGQLGEGRAAAAARLSLGPPSVCPQLSTLTRAQFYRRCAVLHFPRLCGSHCGGWPLGPPTSPTLLAFDAEIRHSRWAASEDGGSSVLEAVGGPGGDGVGGEGRRRVPSVEAQKPSTAAPSWDCCRDSGTQRSADRAKCSNDDNFSTL